MTGLIEIPVDAREAEEIKSSCSVPHPFITAEEYVEFFSPGDIANKYFNQICLDITQFEGSWKVILEPRSDSIDMLLAALGIGVLKRKIVNNYPSITDINVMIEQGLPSLDITAHLPMNGTKQTVVKFDGNYAEIKDCDTGVWNTRSIFYEGRAVQRRESNRGVMFDCRAVFNTDPIDCAKPLEGPLMLFKWTFIPKGKEPIVARRWLQKVSN